MHSSLESTKSGLSAWGVAAGTAIGGFATTLIDKAIEEVKKKFEDTIGEALKLEGAARKLGMTFGEEREKIISNAEAIDEKYGVSALKIEVMADKFGQMARMSGKSAEESAKFSNQMIDAVLQGQGRLGVGFEEAGQAITMGLMGSTRGLKQLMITMTTAQVDAQATAMGFKKVGNAFEQGDLEMARSELIIKALGKGHSELDARLGTTTMMTEQTAGAYRRLYEDIGKMLLPVYKQWVAIQYEFSQAVSSAFTTIKPYLESFGSAVMSVRDTAITGFRAIANTVVTSWRTIFSSIGETIAPITSWMSQIGGSIREWIMDKLDLVGMMWRNLPDVVEISLLTAAGSIKSWAGTVGGYLLMPAEALASGFDKAIPALEGAFQAITKAFKTMINTLIEAWNAGIGFMAHGLDFLIRPLKDLTIALGGTKKSVEDKVNELKFKPLSIDSSGPMFAGLTAGADKFTGLIEKQKASFAELAKSTTSGAVVDRIKEIEKDIGDRERERTARIKADATKAAEAKKAHAREIAGGAASAADKAGSITGVADFASKLRIAQNGGDVPQKQLTELQQIRQQDMENAKVLVEIRDKSFGAMALG